MQIRDYTIVSDLQKGEILLEEIIGIFRRAFKDAPYRKVFSKLYFDLQDLKKYHNLHMKTRWEAEGGFKITLEEWERICKQQSLTTSSPSWREFSWKNVTPFFCTHKRVNILIRPHAGGPVDTHWPIFLELSICGSILEKCPGRTGDSL
jgi:hypothetical protein